MAITRDQFLCARQTPDAIRSQGHHEVSVAWMPNNNSWKYLRTLMKAHLFNPRAIDAGQPIRQKKIQELVTFIRAQAGRSVDIGRVALCTMLNLISNSFFSMDIVYINSDAAQEFKDLIRAISEDAGSPNISDFFPFLAPLDLQGRRRRFTAHYVKLMEIFERIIQSRLKEQGSVIIHDTLDVLLKHFAEDGSKLSMRIIKGFLFDIFVAGTDTSSSTGEWAMAELLRKPELMERARSEIGEAIGFERPVEEADLPGLLFLHSLLKETLPPASPADAVFASAQSGGGYRDRWVQCATGKPGAR